MLKAEGIIHAIAGATGSLVAITLFYPLDTLRTRQQAFFTDKTLKDSVDVSVGTWELLINIIKKEGLVSLYAGLGAVQVTVATSYFIYFFTYESLKLALLSSSDDKILPPLINMGVATIAGSVNVLATTPLWVVNTRMKLTGKEMKKKTLQPKKNNIKKYKNLLDGLVHILKEEGVFALWAGTIPSLILVCNPVIQFLVYERLKWYLSTADQQYSKGISLGAHKIFFAGAIAKLVATIATYPYWISSGNCKSIEKSLNTEKKYRRSTIKMLRRIFCSHGLRGLYAGIETKLWQTVLTAAFMFMTYEKIVTIIYSLVLLKSSLL
eukprot:GSMAST32.ASY1.ANO1.1012.1 assembled CDS